MNINACFSKNSFEFISQRYYFRIPIILFCRISKRTQTLTMSTECPSGTSTMCLLSEFIVIKFKLKPVFLLIITNRIKFAKEFKRLFCIRISCIKEIDKTSSRIYFTTLVSR